MYLAAIHNAKENSSFVDCAVFAFWLAGPDGIPEALPPLLLAHFAISSVLHTSPAMDVNDLPSVSSATKSTLSIQQKNNSNESSKNVKFALKMSETVPSSNQDSDRSATVAVAAKKEAHKKQFIASQATVTMMQPLIFRR